MLIYMFVTFRIIFITTNLYDAYSLKYTECLVFDLLNIKLRHGWVVEREPAATYSLLHKLSYNQAVEKVIAADSPDSEVISRFLAETSSQLTWAGLRALHQDLAERMSHFYFIFLTSLFIIFASHFLHVHAFDIYHYLLLSARDLLIYHLLIYIYIYQYSFLQLSQWHFFGTIILPHS